MARPKKYTDKYISEVCKAIDKYTQETDIPILVEFCYQHNIRKQALYSYDGFSDSIKALIEKKEAQLERKALKKEIDHTMAIFSLKQLGWTDKTEVDINAKVKAEGFEFVKAPKYEDPAEA